MWPQSTANLLDWAGTGAEAFVLAVWPLVEGWWEAFYCGYGAAQAGGGA